eukprot:1175776-Prorocentrum_minimum.AAC.5
MSPGGGSTNTPSPPTTPPQGNGYPFDPLIIRGPSGGLETSPASWWAGGGLGTPKGRGPSGVPQPGGLEISSGGCSAPPPRVIHLTPSVVPQGSLPHQQGVWWGLNTPTKSCPHRSQTRLSRNTCIRYGIYGVPTSERSRPSTRKKRTKRTAAALADGSACDLIVRSLGSPELWIVRSLGSPELWI